VSEEKKMTKAEAGRLGGQKTKEKYGTNHYKKLGEKAKTRLIEMWARAKQQDQ
jgi:hypothetical protein